LIESSLLYVINKTNITPTAIVHVKINCSDCTVTEHNAGLVYVKSGN